MTQNNMEERFTPFLGQTYLTFSRQTKEREEES